MAAKSGGGIGKLALLPIALLSALLFLQALGMLPAQVTNEVTRWASMLGFGYAAVVFAGAGAATRRPLGLTVGHLVSPHPTAT